MAKVFVDLVERDVPTRGELAALKLAWPTVEAFIRGLVLVDHAVDKGLGPIASQRPASGWSRRLKYSFEFCFENNGGRVIITAGTYVYTTVVMELVATMGLASEVVLVDMSEDLSLANPYQVDSVLATVRQRYEAAISEFAGQIVDFYTFEDEEA